MIINYKQHLFFMKRASSGGGGDSAAAQTRFARPQEPNSESFCLDSAMAALAAPESSRFVKETASVLNCLGVAASVTRCLIGYNRMKEVKDCIIKLNKYEICMTYA